MSKRPLANGGNGRDSLGRFVEGNPGGPGNPYVAQVAKLRSLVLDAVKEEDLRAVVAALVEKAKTGDVVAARELFNRLLGRPSSVADAELDRETEPGPVNTVEVIRAYFAAKREAELSPGQAKTPNIAAPTASVHKVD